MLNMIIFGAPGSGKGTQSELLIEKYGLFHISTGDVLRGEIAKKSEKGLIAESFISKGQLIPDELMIEILEDVLDNNAKAEQGVIFDGFPRTTAQAIALEKVLEKRNKKVPVVIGLEVEDGELIERLVNRGKVSGRADDNPETIKNRLEVYHQQTKPLKDYYTERGLYRGIDGTGSVKDIFSRIEKVVDAL